MNRERLAVLSRRGVVGLAAAVGSAAALERIEGLERRLAGAQKADAPSAARRGKRKRRKKSFLVLGQASGDIYDLMAKRHRVKPQTGDENVAAFDGLIVDLASHDAASLGEIDDQMMDAYGAGVPIMFLNTTADLMGAALLETFVALRLEDMPAYALCRTRDADGNPSGSWGVAWPQLGGEGDGHSIADHWVSAYDDGETLFQDAHDWWMRAIGDVKTFGNGSKPPIGAGVEAKTGGTKAFGGTQPRYVEVRARQGVPGIYGANGWSTAPVCNAVPRHPGACYQTPGVREWFCTYAPDWGYNKSTWSANADAVSRNKVEHLTAMILSLAEEPGKRDAWNLYTATTLLAQIDKDYPKQLPTSTFKVAWKMVDGPVTDRCGSWVQHDLAVRSLLGYNLLARFGSEPKASDPRNEFWPLEWVPKNENAVSEVVTGTTHSEAWNIGYSIGLEDGAPVVGLNGGFSDQWDWSNSRQDSAPDWYYSANDGFVRYWVPNKVNGQWLDHHKNNFDDLEDTGCGWERGFCGGSRLTLDGNLLNPIQKGALAFSGETLFHTPKEIVGAGTLTTTSRATYMAGSVTWVADFKDFEYKLPMDWSVIRSWKNYQYGVTSQSELPGTFDLSSPSLNRAVPATTYDVAFLPPVDDPKEKRDQLVRLEIVPKSSADAARYRTKLFVAGAEKDSKIDYAPQVTVESQVLVDAQGRETPVTDTPFGKPTTIPKDRKLAITFRCRTSTHKSYQLQVQVHSDRDVKFNVGRATSTIID